MTEIAKYNGMMSYLTRPPVPKTQVADLVDDLEPGALKDELKEKFDPSQETYEEYLRRERLGERPFNASNGGSPKEEIIEPSKSMQVDTTTKGLPDPLEEFKKQSDLYLQAGFASTNKDYFNSLIEKEYNKALEAGVLPEEAISFLKERSQMYRTLADEGRKQGEPAILGPSYGRENKAIGGGVIEGEDLGTREGFDAPRQIKVDDNALVAEWRNSLKTAEDPVPWRTFLRNKFGQKTADSLKTRIRNDETINLDPEKEFREEVKKTKFENKLKNIQKLVDQHNNSDSLVYTQEDIFEKLGTTRLTYKDNPQEMAIINTMDKPEDKIRKAFDKIITEDMKLYDPKGTGAVSKNNILYQMISDIVEPKGVRMKYRADQRFITKSLSTHKPYLEIKDDFNYFAKEARPFIGKRFKEAFELAKFRRGGLNIQNLKEFAGGYAKPEANIYNFAIRHAYLNHKKGTPSKIKFFKFNKKGEPVGKPLNFDDLPRDRKKLTRLFNTDQYGFTYEDRFFTKKTLKTDAFNSGLFKEVYEITQKGQTLVPDPNDPGKEITLRKLLQDTGDKLTVGHDETLGGVAGEPFKNLKLEGGKFNVAMYNAYNSVKEPKAREMIIKNLIGKFPDATKDPVAYEKAFIASKSQLAKDIFDSPEAVLELPSYYRGAAQKVLADTGKDFFSESDAFKKEITRVADIDLQEYEANKSNFKKNLVLQLARKNNLPPERVEEDLSNVQKVIRKMQGQMNSGIDPKLLVEYLGAEVKDLAAFGQKYGGDVLGKVGTTVAGVDLPIFQVMFGSMYDIEQDSPLWLTIPAAFTDEVANLYGLYNKSEGRFGLGKAKDFGKFVASSFVPRFLRSPIFKAASKIGKAGTLAGPLLEAGAGAYRFEKMKDARDDAIRQFNIPIEVGNKAFDDYIRSTVPKDSLGYLDVDVDKGTAPVPESPGLEGLMRGIKQFGSMVGLADDPYADPRGYPTAPFTHPMLLKRQGLDKGGPPDPSKRTFLKLLSLIPAGVAGLASLRFGPKKVAKVVETAKGAPEWFGALVDKVVRKGVDATKRFATKDREEVYEQFIGEQEGVRVYKDLTNGEIRVEYFSPDNMGGDSIDLVYTPRQITEEGVIPAKFRAVELEPRGIRTGPDDYDIEFDGENVADTVEELLSDTSRLEEFATGKTINPDKAKIAKEKKEKVGKINKSTVEQAEYLETKYGPGDEGDPYYRDYSDYD